MDGKTTEILKQIKDDAAETLKTFSKLYLLNCGCSLLDKIKGEIDKKNGEAPKELPWRLTKREGKREEGLYRGELWMKVGGGAGDFSSWKKVYVVENESGDISIYEKAENIKEGKKPLATIQPGGYQLITSNVREHYQQDLKDLIDGISESTLQDYTSDIEYCSWALAHANRPNYIFQARQNSKSSKGLFSCCKSSEVQPEDREKLETDEERTARERATDFMRGCIDCAHPRDLTTIEGMGFDLTMKQLPQELEKLADDWEDDGTEAQLLVDVLFETCMSDQKQALLNEMKGPVSMRIKVWYKVRKNVHEILTKLVEECWKAVSKGVAALREQLEPKLTTGLTPVVEAKMKVEEKVKEKVIDKLGSLMADYVTPFILPILKLYEKPLLTSLEAAKSVLQEKMKPESLPTDVKERDAYLNRLMYDEDTRKEIFSKMDDVGDALEKLKELSPKSAEIFQGDRFNKVSSHVKEAVGEIFEAAVYTYKIRLNPSLADEQQGAKSGEVVVSDIENGDGVNNKGFQGDKGQGSTDPAAVFAQLMLDFDHDVQIVRSEFIKNSVHSALLDAFHKVADKILAPITKTINDAIPADFQKFLSIQKVLDELMNRFIWSPVEQMVDAAYPLPSD